MVNKLSILGSTGSIGTQTLDVCRKHNINVIAISANRSGETIEQQILEEQKFYDAIIQHPDCINHDNIDTQDDEDIIDDWKLDYDTDNEDL